MPAPYSEPLPHPPTDDQARLSHLLADDLQPRIDWAYWLENNTGGGGGAVDSVDGQTGVVDLSGSYDPLGAAASAQAASQPVDSDLTAIAALTTTAFGRSLLESANAGALRTLAGLGTAATSAATDFQPIDSDLTAIAALTTTSFGRSFLALADAAAARTLLALGTAATAATGDFDAAGAAAAAQAASQPLDSDLTAIAALTTTSFGRAFLALADAAATLAALGLDASLATLALPDNTTISAYGATLVDDADASAARTTLGLGTAATHATGDYDAAGAAAAAQAASQPLDSDLTAIAALSTTSFGRAFLALADAAATLSALGLDADLATLVLPASVTITAAAATLLDDATTAAMLTTLGGAPLASPTFTGTVTLPGDPASALQAATKQYVDTLVSGLGDKPAVAYASTSALPANTYSNGTSGVGATLTGNANGPLVIDSATLLVGQAGERVLVAGEAAQANNGWYTITQVGVAAVSPYILTRATESDQAAEIGAGYITAVTAPNTVTPGSANNGKVFISVAADPFTVGTTALTFSQVGGTYTNGNGIGLSGSTFSIDTAVTVDKTTAQTLTNKSIDAAQLTGSVALARLPTGTDNASVIVGGVITGAGPTGDASHTLALTYNAAGQLTAVTNNAIAIAESQVTSLVSDLALKAPLASPTFTGTPAAPTAAQNTNTTQVATTAFVQAAVASRKTIDNWNYVIGSGLTTTQTGTTGDGSDTKIYSTFSYITTTLTANRVIFLPAANAVIAGTQIRIEDGGGVVTPAGAAAAKEIQIKPAGSDTVEGVAAATNFEVIRDVRGSVLLESDGTSDWKIIEVKPHVRSEFFTASVASGFRKSLVASVVRVRAIGGGGAGGSGQKQVASTAAGGGGGGAGGGMSEMTVRPDQLNTTNNVNVGAGGTAGGTRTSTGAGADGVSGGFSYLRSGSVGTPLVVANGGAGGTGGAAGLTPPGGAMLSGSSHQQRQFALRLNLLDGFAEGFIAGLGGGDGAEGTSPTPARAGAHGLFGASGSGGGGGGVTGAGVVQTSGAGGNVEGFGNSGTQIAGGAAGATATAGTAGTATTAVIDGTAIGGGGGGGGGGRATAGNGATGGAGAGYGGGGGGGGNGVGATGTNSNGNGGVGADGCVEIQTYR